MRSDRTRLINHAIALVLVAATIAVRAALSATDTSAAFLLSSVAVAVAAWVGGVSPGVTATLAALLGARVLSRVDLTTSTLFMVEGLLITWLAAKASQAVSQSAAGLASADARIRTLLAVQQRLRRIDAAAGCLEQLAADSAVFVVDERGRIDEWRPGAARLFGWSADEIRGRSAEQVFAAAGDIRVEQLLSATQAGDASRLVRTCCRADGTSFDADLEIRRLDDEGQRAFIVVVHDRTREQEWRAFADASADLQTTLREEADVAQLQLATLQHVTDPMLNQLSNAQAITALLDRLRAAIEADGVAVVRSARPRRRIVSATDGLAADSTAERRPGEGWTPQPGRILIVHNDPARVEAASIAGWRAEPVSLIAVPVVAGSHVEGTIEAVRLKARRSTEWEIALVQVVAAQIAGRLQSESMFGADAVS